MSIDLTVPTTADINTDWIKLSDPEATSADRLASDVANFRLVSMKQHNVLERFFAQRLKHLAGQHSQRKHGNRGAATLSHGLTAYHITSSDNAAGILQKGLRPASEVGTLGQAPEGQYETEGAFVGNAAQIRVLRNQLLDNDPSTPLTIFEVYLPKKTLVHQDPLMPESSLIIPAGVSPRNLRVVDIDAVRDYPAFDDYTQIFKEWRGYKHLAGQHSQRKHGYRGSETSSDSDIDSNIGSLIDDMRHDRTGYLPEGYENRFDGGPGPSIQYHGTGTRLTSFEGADVVYLQDNPSEAIGYATGGHRMQHARGYVLQVRRKPGKSLNINDHLEQRMMEGDDPDAVINTFIKPARARGYDYLYYEHPTFDEANSVQRVLISLNPATSLKVIGSTVAKDFDLLQRIYEGNRFIIYKHITGQHNQKHSRKALQR